VTLIARRRGVPVPVILVVAGAWVVVVAAQETGNAGRLHHDSLIEGGPPLWAALGVFLLAWQAMIGAMMLPSSLPMVRLFTRAAEGQPRPGVVTAAFLAGYALVWTGFGAVAFLGDVGIHRMVDATPWLADHEWLISAGVLITAGAFQFTDLKDRCLDQCRHPGPFLMRHYRRGTSGAFALGRRHGLFCLGCCWALMLLMFAAGVASLVWMAALGAAMYYEKAGHHGRAITPVVGVALVSWGVVVAAHPAWLPAALAGVAS
jgi:predicted metal-binding membrane protein